jgi:ribA/ribD-fused uncharacterized protein
MTSDNKFFETEDYVLFKSNYPSQWYPSEFTYNGRKFVNCEQMMMFEKANTFGDTEIAEQIMNETDPKKHKELGRAVKNFDPDHWNTVADEIVFQANYAKFSQNPELKEKLLLTGNKKFVECAPYDKIWGNGLDINTTLETPEHEWKGTNRLGKAIMRARDAIRSD